MSYQSLALVVARRLPSKLMLVYQGTNPYQFVSLAGSPDVVPVFASVRTAQRFTAPSPKGASWEKRRRPSCIQISDDAESHLSRSDECTVVGFPPVSERVAMVPPRDSPMPTWL